MTPDDVLKLIAAAKKNDLKALNPFFKVTEKSNLPTQEDVNKALIEAVKYDSVDIVHYLCELRGDNAPSNEAVGDLLKTATTKRIAEQLCETSQNKPSQQDLSDALISAAKKQNWDYVEYLYTKTKPDQTAIDTALELASKENRWPLIIRLCNHPTNVPSENTVGILLDNAWPARSALEGRIKPLCEQVTRKPNQSQVTKILNDILDRTIYAPKWEVVSYFCTLPNERKPDQTTINRILQAAVSDENLNAEKRLQIVKLLCALRTDKDKEKEVETNTANQVSVPSQGAVGEALKKIVDDAGRSLGIVKTLCETSQNKPSQQDLSDALISAAKKQNWDYVEYLYTKTKPDQTAIDTALVLASKENRWPLVIRLCKYPTSIPSQQVISTLLTNACNTPNPLEYLKVLCEQEAFEPNQIQVSELINEILNRQQYYAPKWEIISYFCAPKNASKIDQTTIKRILQTLFSDKNILEAERLEIVKRLCALETANAPDKKTIAKALPRAVAAKAFDVVQYLCELKDKSPNKQAIAKALPLAAAAKALNVVQYFCELEHKTPDHQEITAALSAATLVNASAVFKYLFSKLPKMANEAINKIVLEAVSAEAFEIVLYLCELEGYEPNEEAKKAALPLIAKLGLTEFNNKKFKFSPQEIGFYEEFVAVANLPSDFNDALKKYSNLRKIIRVHEIARSQEFRQLPCASMLEAYQSLEIIQKYHVIFIDPFSPQEGDEFYNSLSLINSYNKKIGEESEVKLEELITNEKVNLDKMSKIINVIDRFVKSYRIKEVAEDLNNFQSASLPLLLAEDSLEVKKQKLVDLAKEEFHHRHFGARLFADILQCITGAFILVMPFRYFSGYHPFFTQEKTDRQTRLEDKLQQLLDGTDSEESAEEDRQNQRWALNDNLP